MNFPADAQLILTIALAVALGGTLGYAVWLHAKLRKFLSGDKAETVGDSIVSLAARAGELEGFRSELESYLASVEKRLKKSVQSVHTVRFNPFHGNGAGGNQSFATAFLNEDGDGVVVSSIYSRDHVSVFAKPVKKHSSEYELSGEEREAMAKARENLK